MREPNKFENIKVSVVVPCFNQGSYLEQAVMSARLAYSGLLEVIVVDDGSTEPKAARWLSEAEQLGDFVRVIRQKNTGLSGARNAGIAAATGDFVQLLDSDDLLTPGKIDIQVVHFLLTIGLEVSVCNFLLCDERRNVFSKPDEAIANFSLKLEDFLYNWERGFVIPIHCALFKRSLLISHPFDVSAKAKEDWLFWCGIVSNGAQLSYLNRHLAIYRQHELSMRRSFVSMGKNWLAASLKIDKMVVTKHPEFFDSAISWFRDCYQSHPLYVEEIALLKKGLVLAIEDGNANELSANKTQKSFSELVNKLKNIDEKNDDLPLISIIVPVYNHYDHFLQCLESIGEQGVGNYEVICVNDASTDQRVAPLLNQISIEIMNFHVIDHEYNIGISATQNEAVNAANGEYVAFLDCDDVLAGKALEKVSKKLISDKTVDYLFTDRLDIDQSGNVLRTAKYGGYSTIVYNPTRTIHEDLLDGMIASHLKVIRRSTYIAVGGTGERFTGCQDWELALKIAESGNFFYYSEPLYFHRIHSKSVTSSELVPQFRKTNELRRIYSKKWLWQINKSVHIEVDSIENSGFEDIARFNSSSMPSIEFLKECWKIGKVCYIDLTTGYDIGIVNFLREFNSYFDKIYWQDPAIPGALIGYLWSVDILDYASFQEK